MRTPSGDLGSAVLVSQAWGGGGGGAVPGRWDQTLPASNRPQSSRQRQVMTIPALNE